MEKVDFSGEGTL